MAECLAIQPFVKFPAHGNCVTELGFTPKALGIGNRRKCYTGYRVTSYFRKFSGLRFTNLRANHYQENHTKCYSFWTLVNPDINSFGWISVIDQVLLISSIFLAHMAGVVPADRSFQTSGKNIFSDSAVPEETFFPGSRKKNDNDNDVNLKLSWDTVKSKLIDSINAIECGAKLENGIVESEQTPKQPSSLSAITEGPRFRLLWSSFNWLKNEVDNIFRSTPTPDLKDLQKIFSEILCRSSLSICVDWLKQELCLRNGKFVKDLLPLLLEKLNGYESVLQSIKKSGKEDLYTELVYVLRFGSLSEDCSYGYNFFTLHGVSILEDLVITLADGIASIYLELISVDSDMSIEMNNLGLNLCTLSTRALQRLRNEVALNQWLYQNMEAIVSMYEDRFDLRTLQRIPIAESSKGKPEKLGWWKKLSLRKSGSVVTPLRVAVISNTRIPVKRTKELRALMGWRYYFSLFLELADITMPFIRNLSAKVSSAVSFFLVSLIGRSLGLIYTGIRQSLRWK